ncbi:ATP-dependent zinc metalloprotease FtsH [Vescimonas coprocola]|uniref:ATP-dependent zinc metalloprotease FtsH n=1 Tax=Vescimonas coprocola TaxID=2714355 RepID=A0A810PXQ9_9FIRM|nr:ATP-dependent zinc metalloprotease FtsH [Vescimonas coprocola]BCK80384.1 ATP-dependent zinc metalloprotease FtsH [Vescimonas coprocola]
MDPNNKKDQKNNQNRNRNMRGVVTLIIWALVLTVVFNYINAYSNNLTKRASSHEIPYSQLIDLIQEDQVAELKIENGVLYATPVDGYVYTEEAADKNKEPKSYTQSEKTPLILYTTALNDASLLPLLEEHNVKYTSPVQTQMSPILEFMIAYILPVIVIVALFMLVMRIMAKNGGGIGGIGSVGKSNAKVYMEKSTGVTFKDVAGQDEAKESLEEIIDFLHNPQKYTAIGARLPKGALLVGSPGTGKTLLAKAVAGEANVPFFSISGSDFVEMFVGVGASRVRDLFKEAAKVAPCIIFIDEIDTIGKSRDGGRFGGGNDEREQTLNQLLAELDGFDPGKGIIVLGATNRPEVLDKALLRPGRFDRRITVDRPNLAGRLATLQVHTRNIHLAEDVNLEKIAQATAGCVGADLANLVNEAALRAVRLGRSAVNQNDLLAAFETVIAGSEKKGTVITDEEKRIIAYHEVGHALVAAKQKNAQPVSKITIVPHTQGALGYTLHLPEEEKFLMSREDILAEIRTLLAGRSSEEVVCHTMTSGAANDIERATEMARNLVARFGMCEEFDMMALGSVQNQYLDGTYSMSCAQETYAAADRAVIAIIRQCHEDAKRMLEENRELLDKIAAYLLKKETITGQEMMAIIEGRDPETVDNYGATREEKQPLFRPSSPEVIEAPAKHIHIVSEPVPSPEEPQTPEEKSPEEAQPDRDPEESEQK